ncbi:MAG: hypothetical protein WCG34_08410, partial [Leptolinea sp.]
SLAVRFTRTLNSNVWNWAPAPPNTSVATVTDVNGAPLSPPNGTVTFPTTAGSIGYLSVPGSAGATSPTRVQINLSGMTMLSNVNSATQSSQDGLAALRASTADLNIALNDVTLATTINGSRMRTLEAAQERIITSNTEIKALLSQKEEVNMAEVMALLKNQENVYQTVVTIASRTQSMMNLFQSLR